MTTHRRATETERTSVYQANRLLGRIWADVHAGQSLLPIAVELGAHVEAVDEAWSIATDVWVMRRLVRVVTGKMPSDIRCSAYNCSACWRCASLIRAVYPTFTLCDAIEASARSERKRAT